MSGAIHGKNAEIRVSVGETALLAQAAAQIGATFIYQLAADKRNWKYGHGLTQVTIAYDTTEEMVLTDDSPYINYAGGAVLIPPSIQGSTIDSVTVDKATSMDLASVGALPSCTRSFEINMELDILDATCLGARFKAKVAGIPDWKGSLDGLYVDGDKFDLAIQDGAGNQPVRVLRMRPDPTDETTYVQGTVIFPSWMMGGSYDALVDENVSFEGNGPLNWVKAGVPHFPNEVTS